MINAAFLIGISSYPNHKLKGVSNDLALLARALEHRNYPPSAIYVYDDTHTTLPELHALLSQIVHGMRVWQKGVVTST